MRVKDGPGAVFPADDVADRTVRWQSLFGNVASELSIDVGG